jgi:hypothetical protein
VEIIAVNIVKMRQAEMPAAVNAAMLDAPDEQRKYLWHCYCQY